MTTSTLEHLADEVRSVALQDDRTRVERILVDRFIAHRALAEIQNHTRVLMLQPRHSRAWGLVVSGAPGAGKTMLGRWVLREFPPQPAAGSNPLQVPAVLISMTGAREARTIYNRILEAMNAPPLSVMRLPDRERLVVRLLRDARTRLLIVDEIQDVLNSTDRQRQQALDTIKFLMNELQLPILTLGVGRALHAMRSDQHLNARFDYRELPQWKVNNDLVHLLASIERALPLRVASNLIAPNLMMEIIKQSEGVLAKIVRLLNYAAVHAIDDGREKIDSEMLKKAEKMPPAHLVRPI